MRDKSLLETSRDALEIDPTVENVRMSISTDGEKFLMANLTNLYTRPETAVLREITANALDSHVRANQTKPILVNIVVTEGHPIRTLYGTNRLSPGTIHLTVQDFGLGMNKEEIYSIYSQYGASTKRETNTQVGAFGLGAKSPLAVTDSYKFVSIKDGIKLECTIYKDKDGIGNIRIDSETTTTEPNGVLIDLSFENRPGVHLLNVAENFFKTWKSGSVLLNGTKPYHLEDDEDFLPIAFNDNDILGWVKASPSQSRGYRYSHNVVTISMGGITYTLDPSDVKRIFDNSDDSSRFIRILGDNTLCVPIGSIDLTPPREGIRFTDKTARGIRNAFHEFEEMARSTFQTHIDRLALADAIRYYFRNEEIITAIWDNKAADTSVNDLTWRNRDFREAIDLSGVNGYNTQNRRIFYSLVFPKSAGLEKSVLFPVDVMSMLNQGRGQQNMFVTLKVDDENAVDDTRFTRNIRDYAKAALGTTNLTVVVTNDDVNTNDFINVIAPAVTLDEIVTKAKEYRATLSKLPKEQRDPAYVVLDLESNIMELRKISEIEDESLILAVGKKSQLFSYEDMRSMANAFLSRYREVSSDGISTVSFNPTSQKLMKMIRQYAPTCRYVVYLENKSAAALKKYAPGAQEINQYIENLFRNSTEETKDYYAIYAHILKAHAAEWGASNYGIHVLNNLRLNCRTVVKTGLVNTIKEERFASLIEYFGMLTDDAHEANQIIGYALAENVTTDVYSRYADIDTTAPLLLSSTSHPEHLVSYLNVLEWNSPVDSYDVMVNRVFERVWGRV